jgi:hypothetical protein
LAEKCPNVPATAAAAEDIVKAECLTPIHYMAARGANFTNCSSTYSGMMTAVDDSSCDTW